LKPFTVLQILYSRDDVFSRKWKTVKADSMLDALMQQKGTTGVGLEDPKVKAFEGVKAAIDAGEDHLIIVSDTRSDVRIAHDVFVEQNQGY